MAEAERFAAAISAAFGEHWRIAPRANGFTAGIDLSTGDAKPDIVTITVTVDGSSFSYSSRHDGTRQSSKVVTRRERELVQIGKRLGFTVDREKSEPSSPPKTPRQIVIIVGVVALVLGVGVVLFIAGLSAGVRGLL